MDNIDINLENIYHLTPVTDDLTKFTFQTELVSGTMEIVVELEPARNPFLQDEFLNLAFGPVGNNGTIDDFAAVKHLHYSKAFSTVIFCGLVYLRENPEMYLEIDGSDFRRAYLYFRILQRNYDYLNEYFRLLGVKYYARVLRGKDKNDDLSIDPDELTSIPSHIDKGPLVNHKSLFNYFLFCLNL